MHRDLKPENLLLNVRGHLQLTDFGSAKNLAAEEAVPPAPSNGRLQKSVRAASLVGTAEYLAPEVCLAIFSRCSDCLLHANSANATFLVPVSAQVLRNEPTGYAADLWAYGCLLYHMLVGKPPFKGASEYLTFQLISAGQYSIPETVAEPAQDLIRKLLVSNPADRLGASRCSIDAWCLITCVDC